MYDVSEAYKAAISAAARTDKINGTITLADGAKIAFDDTTIRSGTLKIDNQCVNGEEIEFGAVYAGQLVFSMDTDIDRYQFYGATVTLSYSIRVVSGLFETIPLGVYTITEAARVGDCVQITALDALVAFESDYDGNATLGTPYQLLTYLCGKAGVPLANTKKELEALPNGKEIFQIDAACNVSTWRDCVAIIAQVLCCFATATRGGELKLCQFGTGNPATTIDGNRRFKTEISDFKSAYRGLKVTDSNGIIIESYTAAETGLVMAIENNPLFDIGLGDHKQALVDAMRVALCNIAYTPATVDCTADPALDCGDVIAYTVNGEQIKSLVTSWAWTYRGNETLKAVGKNPFFASVKGKQDKQTSSLRHETKQAALSIQTFTNSAAITVQQRATQILRFDIVTTNTTSALFWAQVAFTSTTPLQVKSISGTDASGAALTLTYTEHTKQKVTAAYIVSNAEVTNYHPSATFDDGANKLDLFYPLPNLPAQTTVTLAVRLTADVGTALIDAENVKAAVIGTGLASGIATWDGTFDVLEPIAADIAFSLDMQPFTATVLAGTATINTQGGARSTATETIGDVPFTLDVQGFTHSGITESVASALT